MNCRHGLLIAVCVAAACLRGVDPAAAGVEQRVLRDADGEHRYSVYVPPGEAPEQGWPVMLYLHGAGGRGTDGQRHLGDGPAALLSRGLIDWPILVVFPQCEDLVSPIFECWHADSADSHCALQILAEVERDYPTDSQRRILAGWSMGGYGAWSIAAATPDRWAAVMPIAGGGETGTAERLKHLPVWAIHGRLDQAILPERSREMTEAVRRAGGSVTLTLLPGVHHNSWPFAFGSQAVLDWFLDPDAPPDSEQLLTEAQSLIQANRFAALETPFAPEVIIPHAVSIRLGGRALEAISFGIPQQVAPHPLHSELDDVHVSIQTQSADYEVNLTGLNYLASLQRCEIKTLAQGRARLRLGISPLDIVIGRTQITGRDLQVTADSTLVRVGHRRPVWAEIEIRPCIEDHQLRLRLESVDFEIPDDNWYVRAPHDISISGEGISRDTARIGIVGGLYQRRDVFESCIRNTLPGVVEMIEESLAPGDMEQLAAAIWPLPVYQPRLRLRLDDLAVDQDGISVMLGLEADPAVGLPIRRKPLVLAPLGPRATEIHHSDWLEFGIAPGILAPLAQMLIDADAARIDLTDLPHPKLAELGERERLSEFVPALRDLPQDVQVRAELFLVQPFDLTANVPMAIAGCEAAPEAESRPEGDSADIPAAFHAAGLTIRVSTRPPGLDSKWRPLAEFNVALEQSMLGQLVSHPDDQRTIDVRWSGPPRLSVAGRYLDSATVAGDGQPSSNSPPPVDTDRLAELFKAGWQAWTASAVNTHIETPDLVFGGTPLRIERLEASLSPVATDSDPGQSTDAVAESVWWLATYSLPATRLSNADDETLTYQVRSPYSIWGVPRSLAGGEQDAYRVPYPLGVRVLEPFRSRNLSVEAGRTLELPTGP